MRVLHINQFGSYIGGVEGYIADVSQALAVAGHEAKLISFAAERSDNLIPDTVQIDTTDLETALFGIQKVIADFRPDVAYLHVVYDPVIVRYVCDRLPAVAYVHSPYLVCPGYALFLQRSSKVCQRVVNLGCLVNAQVERCCFGRNPVRHIRRLREVRTLLKTLSQIDVLVGSDFMRRQLCLNGLRAEKVSLLAPLLFPRSTAEYMRPTDPKAILFAGRITQEKGLRNLIQALASVQSEWRLIVAGDGPDRNACELLAKQLRVSQYIEFVGWVTPEMLKMLYQRCALVVVPSLWPEPYGRIGPEAFLQGRPVVAYAVGGIPDWLEDGETGRLAIPGDIDSLRVAIASLIENPDECERMGRTARERAEVRWNAETHIQILMESFHTAIESFNGDTSWV